jgi:DNA-binding CsgD family transcriptional regulator
VLRAVPLTRNNDLFDLFRPAALLTLVDLDQPQRVRRDDLIALFDLTSREADIAALLGEGETTEGVARRLEISEHTVRQHLKAIFGKVGVSRQAELVGVVSRLI